MNDWTMVARIRPRIALLGAVGAIALVFGSAMPRANAQTGSGNLPVYTSPIDITGLKLQLRLAAPDRETGRLVDVTLPAGMPPGMNQFFSTPLSTQLDQYWNSKVDPATGMTARAAACDSKDGIKQQVATQIAKLGSSYSAYDITCDLATTGHVLVKQIGSTLLLAYQLTGNTVSFASTSPGTCHAGSGTPVCPNDPRFTVRFATQINTVLRTPALCALTAEVGKVEVVGVSIESQNAAAAVAKFFGGQKFLAAEIAIAKVQQNRKLPIDDAFSQIRSSDACNRRTPGVARVLAAFPDMETVIDMRQGVIMRATHVGIARPSLDAPNAVGRSAGVPSFTRPMIATAQPIVTAGTAVQTRGQYFPTRTNLATTVPLGISHPGYARSTPGAGGVCFGGVTEVRWGPLAGPLRLVRFPGDAQGNCAPSYVPTGLTPGTAYVFSARDCDPITCSPWSHALRAQTATAEPSTGTVVLTLDAGTPLGTAAVDGRGAFATSITIPANTSMGAHTLRAADGVAKAEVTVQVAPPPSAGRTRASMMMVAQLRGETNCPNHPIGSTQTDDTFMLFGSGFSAGAVTVHLDTATGATLGAATVRADGTFCQQMQSAPGNKAGAHTLVAVQNGTVAAQTAVTFVLPSGVR